MVKWALYKGYMIINGYISYYLLVATWFLHIFDVWY